MSLLQFENVLNQRIKEQISELHTTLIARIIELNQEQTKARVKFLQKDIRVSDKGREMQVPFPDTEWIPIMPIFWSDSFQIWSSYDIGNKVEVIVSERPIIEPLTNDELSEQQRFTRMNISDCYISRPIPEKAFEREGPAPTSFVIKHKKGSNITIDKDGNLTFEGFETTMKFDTLTFEGKNIAANVSSFKINDKEVIGHQHTDVTSGKDKTGGMVNAEI